MVQVVAATFKDGVFKPDQRPALSESTRVRLVVETINGDVKLKIPAGTQSGEIFRLKGHGLKHLSHFGHGDQYVKIQVVTPKDLSREEKEIFENLKK